MTTFAISVVKLFPSISALTAKLKNTPTNNKLTRNNPTPFITIKEREFKNISLFLEIMKLCKCPSCKTYSIKEICPKCNSKTTDAHYKFLKFWNLAKKIIK